MAAFRAILLFLLLGTMNVALAAKTSLRDYALKVKNVQLALESLRQEESGIAREERSRAENVVAYARRQLPASETIERPEGPLIVNNEWLAQELDEYQELELGSKEAEAKLESIAHRLASLRDRLEEAQRITGAAHGATKDEQKGQLERILRRREFNARKAEENALARLWRAIKEWLRNLLPQRALPLNEGQAQRASPWVRILIYVFLLSLLVFALRRVWPMLRRNYKGRNLKLDKGPRVVLGETLAPDQSAADLFGEAENLALAGELRAAIRKGYIALLCELGDRKAIRLEQHKTNRDYLRDVSGEPALYQNVRQLTNRFEFHWYGLAPARQSDWEEFRKVYQGALK